MLFVGHLFELTYPLVTDSGFYYILILKIFFYIIDILILFQLLWKTGNIYFYVFNYQKDI